MIKKREFILLSIIIILISLAIFNTGFFANEIFDSNGNFSGTFNLTFYNSSGFIQLNASIIGNSSLNITDGSEMNGNESGLIGYWRFNETSWNNISGEVKDVLGKYNGTAKSGANISSGLLGNAGNFSGTTGTYVNEVQINNSLELNPGTGSFTITGWAKSITRGGNGYQLYVAKRDNVSGGKNGYYIGLYEGSGIKFVVGDGTNRVDTSYVDINYTNWFYFAAVINRTNNQILLYINGTLGTNSSISSVGSINNSWNLSIGNDEGQALLGSTYQYPVKGQIDEVGFWNRALSSSEILSLYNQGLQNITNSTTNSTIISSGTYESVVKDTNSIVDWTNITWNGLQASNSSGIGNITDSVLTAHFEESSGKMIDSSAYYNNGTNNGASYGATGKSGSALSFDGVNDYIDFGNPSHLQITGNISLAVWIKFNQIPSGTDVDSIVDKNEGGGYGIIANEQLVGGLGRLVTYFYIGGAYRNAGVNLSTLNANTWYHILAIYNGTSVDFYLDGVKKESVAITGAISNVAYNLTVGANPGPSYTEFFNGTIDEVYIFNRILNSSEIASLSGNSSSATSVEGLKFQLRTSNDNVSWSSYTGSDGTSNSYYDYIGNLNLTNSRYVQYKAYISNSNAKLYNISFFYDIISGLSVSLDSPIDGYFSGYIDSINVTCSAVSNTQLSNVSIYHDKFGWAIGEPAKMISGTTNTTSFVLNEINSAVHWNCYFCDINDVCMFADNNRTIIGDILAPEINLVSPSDNYIENSSFSVDFIFNTTDNRASLLSCDLFIDNILATSNSSVITGFNTIMSSSLLNGNHSWKINCSDGINSVLTEERNLIVNISSAYVPFWAKTNTHTHTTNSDGDSSPTTVVNLYKNKGYSILAITDHGYVTNCTPFTNLSANFLCVNSEEWTSTKHVVRVNVSSPYNNAAINLQNAVNAANSEGGFAIAAHPNWSSTIWSVSDLITLQNYTAMEIYNKVIERLTPDPYAVNQWDSVLISGKKIFGVAADDMHQVNVDLGYGFTKVYMPEFTKESYINSMRTGYFYSSQGPSMDSEPFTLACDEIDIYHMGESANCSAVRINATISSTNSSFVVRNISLIKDGNIINISTCSTQNCSFSYSQNVSSSGYYRLQATDSYNKQIWSNPIWVTKIALPVIMTINSPENNSNINDYTPLINISLNQQTSLWYSINYGNNITLCDNCAGYMGYSKLIEGQNILRFYANNSDNIVKQNIIYINLDFNKSIIENFSDNSSIYSINNVFWNNNKISFASGNNSSYMFGNFILNPILTINNITSFHISWLDNNTEYAKGDGQRTPIILKYKFGNDSWIDLNSYGDYISNGSTISGLNSNNLSLMFDFEKNNNTPIDLLNFEFTWTEFTVPLIYPNVSKTTTTTSATISWTTDTKSNSSLEYGNSVILGNVKSNSDNVSYHSLTIDGLSQNTVYYFKIKSCTKDSCAEYPQSPYPVDSFTTQYSNPPASPSGGGSSSGGGGGLTYVPNKLLNKTLKVEISPIGDIIAREGDKKSLVVAVKNTGDIFLNNCRLVFKGNISSWFFSKQVQGISPGETVNFIYDINVPEEIYGENEGILELKCDEITESQTLKIIIPQGKNAITIKELEYIKQGLNISYDINTGNLGGEVTVEIWLVNEDGIEEKRIKDIFISSSGEAILRNILMELPEGMTGIYTIYFANSNDLENFVKQSVVLGKSSTTGFSILDEPRNKMIVYVIFVFILFAVVFLIMWGKSKNKNKGILLKKKIKR
jgi:hypothetical protein